MDALLSFLLQNGDEIDLDEQPVTPSSANTENINAFDFQISNIIGNLTINASIGKDSTGTEEATICSKSLHPAIKKFNTRKE